MSTAAEPESEVVSRRFACAAGERDYLFFAPASRRGPRGLVVMLHGCKQSPADFAAATGMNEHATENGLAVLWPGQSRADNPNGCWNWFRPAHQKRGFGEPAILSDLTRQIIVDYDIPGDRVFCAGFSAGAAMALILRETYPDIFAAIAAHSGIATGIATNGIEARAAMRGDIAAPAARISSDIPTLAIHGMEDDVVHPVNAERIAGVVETRMLPRIGHGWSGGPRNGSYTASDGPDITREILNFFMENSRARPRPLLLRAARSTGLA